MAHEITIFRDVVRIDVQTMTPGINFEETWQKREIMEHKGQKFYVVSLDDLIVSKQAAGRDKDLEDVSVLKKPTGTSRTPHTADTPLNPLSRGEFSQTIPLLRGD